MNDEERNSNDETNACAIERTFTKLRSLFRHSNFVIDSSFEISFFEFQTATYLRNGALTL